MTQKARAPLFELSNFSLHVLKNLDKLYKHMFVTFFFDCVAHKESIENCERLYSK